MNDLKNGERPIGLWLPTWQRRNVSYSLCGKRWLGGKRKWNYCSGCGAKMDIEAELPAGGNVYKLCFPYTKKDSVYLSTDMSKEQAADIYVGFELYIETNTKYGDCSVIDIDVAAHLLCDLFGCSVFNKENLHLLGSYDPKQKDLTEDCWIDLYEERERRCGEGYERYIQNIMEYTDTEFVRKLCAYFDSEDVYQMSAESGFLSPEQIMEWY